MFKNTLTKSYIFSMDGLSGKDSVSLRFNNALSLLLYKTTANALRPSLPARPAT